MLAQHNCALLACCFECGAHSFERPWPAVCKQVLHVHARQVPVLASTCLQAIACRLIYHPLRGDRFCVPACWECTGLNVAGYGSCAAMSDGCCTFFRVAQLMLWSADQLRPRSSLDSTYRMLFGPAVTDSFLFNRPGAPACVQHAWPCSTLDLD